MKEGKRNRDAATNLVDYPHILTIVNRLYIQLFSAFAAIDVNNYFKNG
ncbi:hypothetical protein ACQKLG_11670 [Pedobacter suwonensis]